MSASQPEKTLTEDISIIREVISGNKEAYGLLVDRYKDKVWSLAMGMVKSNVLAEEIAMDALVRAYENLGRFRQESSFSTWLYRITYNTTITYLRKHKRTSVSLEEITEPAEEMSSGHSDHDAGRINLLESALKQLSSEEQVIVRLYYMENQSVKQLSAVMGHSESNIKVKLHRVRNKLKTIIQSNESQNHDEP